ncbi:MAG: hypothetical protein OXE46_01945 [Chloroflexi bacterium]|nr:hypothetical protein [Chloroflexota bacterium]
MEANMKNPAFVALDRRLTSLVNQQANIATKAGLAQLETRLVKWMIATQLAVIGFLFSTQLAMAALVIHLLQ